jgi:hypothetical protein
MKHHQFCGLLTPLWFIAAHTTTGWLSLAETAMGAFAAVMGVIYLFKEE